MVFISSKQAVMELFEKLGIKIPNAVVIEGANNSDTDEEIIEFLKKYGSIAQTKLISEPGSTFDKKLIVEFSSGFAVDSLRKLLPYTYVSQTGTVTYEIYELATTCASQIEKVKTSTYLRELQAMAKLTGKDYAVVLKDVMSLLGHSIAELRPELTDDEEVEPTEVKVQPSVPSNPEPSDQSESRSHGRQSYLNPVDTNPPEVRYVVEHVIKNDDSLHHSAQKLKTFSGRVPRPPNETDYETWRSAVELMLNDPSISDLHRSRKIVESLLPPAATMVKHLTSETPPVVYIQILDSAYGTVQDGDELFAKFMDTFQDGGEKPSVYLQRLQVAISAAVKRGGVPAADINRHLLSQFCRGCWDNALISDLQLKRRKSNPPSFSELLLLLRTEEDREAAKSLRMRQHLGPVRAKAHVQQAYGHLEEKTEASTLEQLSKQVADIQRQLASLTAAQSGSKPSPAKSTPGERQRAGKSPSVPKPGYCYRCGEDGHIRTHCENPPNSTLVAEKKKRFAEKRNLWQRSSQTSNPHLN